MFTSHYVYKETIFYYLIVFYLSVSSQVAIFSSNLHYLYLQCKSITVCSKSLFLLFYSTSKWKIKAESKKIGIGHADCIIESPTAVNAFGIWIV